MIVGAALVRNEAGPDRWLARVLAHNARFCDALVVLDDGSTDETAALCRAAGAAVYHLFPGIPGGSGVVETVVSPPGDSERSFGPVGPCDAGGGWWGRHESAARQTLWEIAAREAGADGWVLVFDADMLLEGMEPHLFRKLALANMVNAWCWPLCDCWNSETLHRTDGYWRGHTVPRAWMARAQPHDAYVPLWGTKSLHAGHIPPNYPIVPAVAPGAYWRHLAYVSAEHRAAKMAAYLGNATLSPSLALV